MQSLPTGAKVLVVIDYEPSLTGEMEAIGGPLLDQVTLSRAPRLYFVSTAPNGVALVERLLSDVKINKPMSEDGFGYKPNKQYCNIGFLPGGAAGALGFIEAPGSSILSKCEGMDVASFSTFDALILMTDQAESGQVWVEQLTAQKQKHPALVGKPFIAIASAQAGPLLQPYVSSGQVTGMISGLSEAAQYEYMNTGSRPGIARSYWDAFGVGLVMAIVLILIGSLWSLIAGIRARRAEAEQG